VRNAHGGVAERGIRYESVRNRIADEDATPQPRRFARGPKFVYVIDVAKTADGDERRRFALSKKVFDVTAAQRRIRGDQDGADLCERELQDDPFGHVRRPQHDALARGDADRDEAARNGPRLTFEGCEWGTRAARVNQRFVVRQRMCQAREEIADGEITKWRLAHRGRIVPQWADSVVN